MFSRIFVHLRFRFIMRKSEEKKTKLHTFHIQFLVEIGPCRYANEFKQKDICTLVCR